MTMSEKLYQQQKFSASTPELGDSAPDFTLHSTPDQTVSLSQFRGNPVILAF